MKLTAASAAAFAVFFIAQVPLLIYAHRSLDEFEPGLGLVGIAAHPAFD